MYKHVLLPTDGSGRSERAIAAGIELAKLYGARVSALFVSEATYIEEIDAGRKPRAEAALAFAEQVAAAAGVTCTCVSSVGETPQQVIVDYAQSKGCDLVVMGTHGRSRVGKFFLGSVAASVLADCDVPVLLYR